MSRWTHIDHLFDQVLDQPPAERTAYLEKICAGDPDLLHRLEALLAAAAQTNPLLEQPAAEFATPLIQDLVDEQDTMEGRRIGPYEILRELGRGGMGTVYLAQQVDGELNRRVALKLIKRGMDTEAVVHRFRHERDVLAGLQHPNIARLLDGGTTPDGLPYFAMAYIEGEPIDAYCTRLKLDVRGRLRLFQTVCTAVQYAHQNLVVHRDLKPSNILVTKGDNTSPEGQVKLLDFGIAKVLGTGADAPTALYTQTGMRIMTPAYAAPEQIRDQRATTATDVYALGVVLYELLTGTRPYDLTDKAPGEIERLILEAEPKRPSKTANQLSGDLDTICLKALQKDPTRRYPSAEQLHADIERFLTGLPVLARPDTLGYRARKFIGRNKIAVGLGTLAVLALLTGLLTALWQANVADRAAEQATAEATKAQATVTFMKGIFENVSPDEAEGAPITARRIVQAGVDKLEALEDQPLVQAQMMATLGELSYTLALYGASDSLWSESLAIRQRELGSHHLDIAKSLEGLAKVKQTRQRVFKEAIALLQASLAIKEAALGTTAIPTLEAMYELAWAHYMNRDFENAESQYISLIEQYEILGLKQSEQYGESLDGYATLLMATNRYDEAEPILQKALNIQQHVLGPREPSTLFTMFNLASCFEGQNKWSEAETAYQDVLALSRLVLGQDHNQVANTLLGIGRAARHFKKYDHALAANHEALSIYEKTLGEQHFYTVYPIEEIGAILTEQGNWSEAEDYLRQGLSLYHLHGAEATYLPVLQAKINLGNALRHQNRYPAAEKILVEVYQAAKEVHNQQTQKVLSALIDLYKIWPNPQALEKYQTLLAQLEP